MTNAFAFGGLNAVLVLPRLRPEARASVRLRRAAAARSGGGRRGWAPAAGAGAGRGDRAPGSIGTSSESKAAVKPVSDRSSTTGVCGAPTETRVILPALPRFIASIDGCVSPKRAKQPTWLHQANGYCRCSPASTCTTTPVVSSVPSGVTTVTPAAASALLRQLQDADLGDRVLLLVDARAGT